MERVLRNIRVPSKRANGKTRRSDRYIPVVAVGILICCSSYLRSSLENLVLKRTPEGISVLLKFLGPEPLSAHSFSGAASSPRECLMKNGLAYGPFRDGQSPDYDV